MAIWLVVASVMALCGQVTNAYPFNDLSTYQLRTLAQAGNNLTEFKSTLRKVLKLRVPGTLEHTQVKQAIVNHFEDLGGWDVSLDKFDEETVLGKKSFSNIIVTLNPSVDRRLVLACHYDTKFYASSPEGKQFLGATDSAVSCAILMELAKRLDKYLKAPNIQKEVTLQMVFFDGEEAFLEWTATDSLYGSRHLAALWQNTTYPPGSDTTMLSGIDDLVLLDLLGARHPSIYNFFSDTSDIYNQLMDIEKRLSAEELTARVSPYFVGSAHSPIFVEDDHVPFLEKGVPIVHIIPVPFPSVWHTLADDEDALDYDTISKLNIIFQVFVSEYLLLNVM
ncbi:glutaminyl-peptide cyclotransferase-like [Saccoglossus kowalevskii]|uniref:Glutaminyl-peptide cyclotransferase n=1 Tax=Saccoglossus kowalevskii TaxID=10224 RepID=A0A0U2IDQ7_SACKO|nr:glutaminyl-peptide cyclotransferase-like 381 [Saccoglossus kowalevskii]